MSSDRPGFELPLRLLLGFRVLVDDLHEELARQGHPAVRPMHGFALQAVGEGTTAAELAGRLGVSKQAAGKTIATLEGLGYVQRRADDRDARRKQVVLTDHGLDCLTRSARILDDLRAGWARTIGQKRLRALEDSLREVTPGAALQVDVPGWFGA